MFGIASDRKVILKNGEEDVWLRGIHINIIKTIILFFHYSVSNMHLYPVVAKRMPPLRSHPPRVDLIGHLIAESNALLGTFRRVSHAIGPKLRTTTPKSTKLVEAAPLAPLQPLKWDGILEEACERLSEKLEKLK